MRPGQVTVGVLCGLLLLMTGCRGTACCPPPRQTIDYWILVGQIESGDGEGRYHAILELARFEGAEVRALLRGLLHSDEILTQNAAARVLVGQGAQGATTILIENLDRDNRTWAVTDAIHHLRALHAKDWGYEPNLGYRAQSRAQAAWWGWWQDGDLFGWRHPSYGTPTEAELRYDALAQAIRPQVNAYLTTQNEDRDAAWEETVGLWKALADLQPSRKPEHVALVSRAFGEMTKRWPTDASLANNQALAALNNSEYEAAEAGYERALRLSPDEAFFHNDFGILLEGLGRWKEAEMQYREAIRLDDSDSTWWSNLADVLRRQGRREEAIAAYREAEKIAPEKWYYHRLWIKRLSAQ